MQFCTLKNRNGKSVCTACGWTPKPAEVGANRRCPKLNGDSAKPKLLGDRIAAGLESIGIKKNGCGGCEERQQKLNSMHEKINDFFKLD